MERTAEYDLPVNQLDRRRDELVGQTNERLEHAAGVFQLAMSFCPERVTKMTVLEMPPKITITQEDGREVASIGTMPDFITRYSIFGIVLPVRRYNVGGNVVERSAVAKLSVEYDNSNSRDLNNALPTDMPAPDRISIAYQPVLLGESRFDDPYESTRVQTISGDFVEVYKDDLEPEDSDYLDFGYPIKHYKDEHKDWGALLAYSKDALSSKMLDLHANQGEYADAQLDIITQALLNEDLNPRLNA